MNRDNGASEAEHLSSSVGTRTAIRTRFGAPRSRRVIGLAVVACAASLALVALPAAATTTTVPADTTTTLPTDTTTTLPIDTTTTLPAATTTTLPPETTTTTLPDLSALTGMDLTPDEKLANQPTFVYLSDGQRAVLQQLQNANDTVSTRSFALFGLARLIATTKDQLKASRARENAAAEHEILGLLDAALDPNDATTQDPSVPTTTSDVSAITRADTHAPSDVDALARSLDADRKSARRARVQAQDRLAALNALVTSQTKALTDAAAAKTDAESAAESALGSDAVRPQADGITATLATVQAGQTDAIVIPDFALPIPGAALGSPFGIRVDPLGGGAGFHPGIDLDGSSGTPIQAAAAGVVVMAGDCGGYGNCVVIDHGSSLATVYGHQSEVHVQVGDHVVAGQVIGLVGSTGKSTGPHLHFELRLHGIPIDPVPTLTP